jgi:ferredoxin
MARFHERRLRPTPSNTQMPRKKIVSPSTRAFVREAKKLRHFSLFDALHGYVYARWTYFYISVGTGEHPLSKGVRPIYEALTRFMRVVRPDAGAARAGKSNGGEPGREPPVTFADTYHGKVVPLDAATKLVTVNKDINLGDLEKIIPYALARDLVLNHPDHIVLLQCPCRTSREKPCTPLDVCLIVGEPFASFMAEHHGGRTRWITAAEAVEILRAEDERGHVHHAFFKDAMLGRFYAICNCCSCCCGAMQAQRNGTPMLASSGYVSSVNEELCVGCGECAKFCQFGALGVLDAKNAVDTAACMGCGVCVTKCEHGALSLERDPHKGMPLEIGELMNDALRQEVAAPAGRN